jgi:hypothetical protein
MRSRFLIVALWAVSLVLAAQFGASAQFGQNEHTPGTDVRFIQLGVKNGMPEGIFAARINGEWKGVQIYSEPVQPGPIPIK